MTARRAIIGLCAICALLISAVAAQGASAAGTTAYTCKAGSGTFGVDCAAGTTGTSGHVAIAAGTKTELSGSGTTTLLQTTIAGAAIKLTSVSVSPGAGENWMENAEVGGEMNAHGEGSLTYNEVTVNLPNCTVVGLGTGGGAGMITTKRLVASTAGVGDALKFSPASGTVFAEFELTGASCSVNGLKVTVTGNVTGTPNGAFVEFTHAATTTQNTLKANGSKAGIEGKLTLTARANSTEAFTPLSVTT